MEQHQHLSSLNYFYGRGNKILKIVIPSETCWHQIWRGKKINIEHDIVINLIHSKGGRIPKEYRSPYADFTRGRRQHSRILLAGNPLKKGSRSPVIIVQDDDTAIFADKTGRSLTPELDYFGQMSIIHHEIGHILQYSQRLRHTLSFTNGTNAIEEAACDIFSLSLTLDMTKDIQSATAYAGIRSDYLLLRQSSALEFEIRATHSRANFESRFAAGLTLLGSLDYLFCANAMDYVLDEWRKSPWPCDIETSTQMAINWIRAKKITPNKTNNQIFKRLMDMLPDIKKASPLVRIFLGKILDKPSKCLPKT